MAGVHEVLSTGVRTKACMHILGAVMAVRMASITSIHLPRSRTAVLQRTSDRFSVDRSF